MRIGEYLQVGAKMKNARIANGLSQGDMAKKLGLSNSAYSNYENSYSEPQIEIIQEFCKVLNISVKDLFEMDLPSKSRSPITTYSDVLYVFTELEKLGMTIEYDCHKDENTNSLIANVSFHNPQMVALINGLSEYKKYLATDKIDKEEYNLEISSMMSMFNVPINEYIDKK